MPEITINDIVVECSVGETLDQIARRAGLIIGIMCNGATYHVLCEFKILEGGEYLSPVSEDELKWLSTSIAGEGHRLGCQARVMDNGGPIKVLTLSESVRRRVVQVVGVPNGLGASDATANTSANLVQIAISHVIAAPLGLIRTMNNGGPKLSVDSVNEMVKNSSKALENFLNRKNK